MSWHGAVGVSLTNCVCQAVDNADRMLYAAHFARRTTQLAEHAMTQACPV